MIENRRNNFAWILLGGGIILFVVGLFTVLLKRPTQPTLTATPASVEQVQRVSLEDAKAAFDAKTAEFLDVRASSSFEVSHIPGAISIPSNEITARIEIARPADLDHPILNLTSGRIKRPCGTLLDRKWFRECDPHPGWVQRLGAGRLSG